MIFKGNLKSKYGLSRVLFSSKWAKIDVKPHHSTQGTPSTPAPSLVLTLVIYHRRLLWGGLDFFGIFLCLRGFCGQEILGGKANF